jgi:Type VI secretion, TssG
MDNLLLPAQLPFDIRAEVVARMLAEQYDLKIHQVLFKPTQYFQRWGRKDVLDISEGYSGRLDKETISLEISQESMYDALPEGLFLHPEDRYADDLERIKKLGEQEAAARTFLLPFEQLFYWLRLENEFREADLEANVENWWQQQILRTQHIIPAQDAETLEREAIKTLMLPYLTEIVGNWATASQWLSLFLKTDVQVLPIPPPNYDLSEAQQKRLGEGILGEDFILGKTFSDGIPAVQILLYYLNPENIRSFLPCGKQRILLEEELLALLLPMDTHYEIELGVKTPSTEFYLDNTQYSNVLGYTTTI